MFLTSVSGGLVALGLVATATRVGTTFYAFGLALLVTLTFVGLVTFDLVLQSGIEDHGYARRIALLRSYYFDNAPEVTPHLLSVSPEKRLQIEGLWAVRGQELRTVTGMVGVVTAVLAARPPGYWSPSPQGIRLHCRSRSRSPLHWQSSCACCGMCANAGYARARHLLPKSASRPGCSVPRRSASPTRRTPPLV